MSLPVPCPDHDRNELGCPECTEIRATYYRSFEDGDPVTWWLGRCGQELCPFWPGEGCVIGIFDCPTPDTDDNDDETPRDPADDDSGYGPSSAFSRSMRKDD